MSSYKESQWKVFRQSVIELDGYKCRQCGRGQDEVILQVHHKEYKSGLKAWEYPTADCLTLCRGCTPKHTELFNRLLVGNILEMKI